MLGWSCNDWIFCRLLRSINCWQLVKRHTDWFCACGPTFWGELKRLASEKALKIKYHSFCTKLNVCGKYQGKTSSLSLELGKKLIAIVNKVLLFKSPSTICRLGYHVECTGTLPSYIWLRNRSYTLNFKILHSYTGHSTSHPTSWSHHHIILLDTGILSTPVQCFYLGR